MDSELEVIRKRSAEYSVAREELENLKIQRDQLDTKVRRLAQASVEVDQLNRQKTQLEEAISQLRNRMDVPQTQPQLQQVN